MSALRVLAIVPIVAVLGGCAMPPSIQILSLAVNGFSYAASGKSAADHGISAAVQKDCSLIRIIRNANVCDGGDVIAANAFAVDAPPKGFLDGGDLDGQAVWLRVFYSAKDLQATQTAETVP
ncbi:MAG: hypothetical protein O3A51_14570 [Verrucomicrobia bacterium]|nr:hypothetical protein [Verrucomicrobiota bacterium]